MISAAVFFPKSLSAAEPGPSFEVRAVESKAYAELKPEQFESLSTLEGEKVWVERTVLMRGAAIVSAKAVVMRATPPSFFERSIKSLERALRVADQETTNCQVIITFSEEGRETLRRITTDHDQRRLAIFAGGKLLTAPRVQEPIVGGVLTIFDLNETEAMAIATEINDAVAARSTRP